MKIIVLTAVIAGGLFTACKKEAETANRYTENAVTLFFEGGENSTYVRALAGEEGIVNRTVSAVNDRLQPLAISADEQLFVTGSRFANGGGGFNPLGLSVFFAVGSPALIQPGVYAVAAHNPGAAGLYSAGKVAVKWQRLSGPGEYTSYHPFNTGSTGFFEVTKVQRYTESGRVYQRVEFILNLRVFKITTTPNPSDSLRIAGFGAAVF